LIVGNDLQSRRFVLDARGNIELMPQSEAGGQRRIFHRTFILSLDVADSISLFYGGAPRSCVIGRDQERKQPLQVPVFFVGHVGESLDELKENAENVAFAPSESLNIGANFTDIGFRLRRGGSRFGDIRPFFRCGLPGLMLCESSCPGDSINIAASLVNSVVNGVTRPALSSASPANEQTPPVAAQPRLPAPPSAAQAPSPEPPVVPERRPPAPVTPSVPPAAEASPRALPNPPAPPAPAPVSPETRRLVLSLERNTGVVIAAADVLAAEGSINIEGVQLSASGNDLAADLSERAFEKWVSAENLQTIFRRHRIDGVKTEGTRIVLTAEPLYVLADNISIKIQDASGEPVRGCELALDVFMNRRLGEGWAKFAADEKVRGLSFSQADTDYVLDLPANIEENELLISTAEPGDAARLSNVGAGCELEGRPFVAVEELRTAVISRSLQATGPILISLLSTDSNFTATLGPAAVDGFWTAVLDLISAVSQGPWERSILARAQAPGTSEDTGVLWDMRSGSAQAMLADQPSILAKMRAGSRPKPEPRSIIRFKPVERFHLDLALKPIRDDAGIPPRQSLRQEALVVVSGSVKATGSYFCQHPVRRDRSPWATPLWAKQARKVLALEVWSSAAAEAMQRTSRAKQADDAPEGVFLCNLQGSDGGKIAVYGVLPEILSNDAARGTAFDYLKAQAENYLRP
jgi:hypothetical protein